MMLQLYCYLFLLVATVVSRPINEKDRPVGRPVQVTYPDCGPPSNSLADDVPPPKRSKLDEVVSNQRLGDTKCTECYFAERRITERETRGRPQRSEVSSKCSTDDFLTSFKVLIDNHDELVTKHGARNEADLVLARGAGEFEHDWDDENVVNKIGERFICKAHREELSSNWNHEKYKHIRIHHQEDACSIPIGLGYFHKTNPPIKQLPFLKHADAKAVLFVTGLLLHEGITICRNHEKYIDKTFATYILDENNRVIYPQPITGNLADSESLEKDMELSRAQCSIHAERTSRCKNINYKESPEKTGIRYEPQTPKKDRLPCTERALPYGKDVSCNYERLMDALKINPHSSNTPWNKMSVRNKYRHVAAFIDSIKKIAVLAVGEEDAENLIRAAHLFSQNIPSGYWQNAAQIDYLEEISKLYYSALSSAERRVILSTVADVFPIGMLGNYISGLTSYGYYAAKKAAIRQKNHQIEYDLHSPRPRVKLADLDSFVGFICSEMITTALPFGNTPKVLSNGVTVEIPSAVRNFRASDIIRMYKNDMDRRNLPVKLSDSTMRRVLEACPAKQKKTLDAVDSYKASGLQAFEWMKKLMEPLRKTIHNDYEEPVKTYMSQLIEAEFFLKADYYSLLEYEHLSADLCLNYALSDKDIKEFRGDKCNTKETHLYYIQRAFIFDNLCTNILLDIGEYAKNNANDDDTKIKLQQYEITVRESQIAIIDWRNHIVRKRFSNDIRTDIISNLGNGDALITIDYAQKWLPRRSMESQPEYYGKAGLSMHVMHCICKQFDEILHHTVVHFLGHADQTYITVTAILISGLKILAAHGVKNVILRSDNAVYYRSSPLLMSIPSIGEEAGINIQRYSFSEPQAGKSSADVETARLKNVLRSYLNSGHDILTEHHMLEAIDKAIESKALYGVTAIVPEKVPVKEYKTTKKLDLLYFIGDVEYSKLSNGVLMRYWKHYKIGDGMTKILTAEDTTDLPATQFQGDDTLTRPALPFWRSSNMNTPPQRTALPVNPTNNPVDPEESTEVGGLYRCSFEGCIKEYISAFGLERHMISGKHTLVSEGETIQETTYKLYADSLLGLLTSYVSSTFETDNVQAPSDKDIKPEGWALKPGIRNARFKKHVKDFLTDHFLASMRRGQKRVNAFEVQDEMRKSTTPLFTVEERLSAVQIANWYSRSMKELKKLQRNEPENMTLDPYQRAATKSFEAMETETGNDEEYLEDLPDEYDTIMSTLANNNDLVYLDRETTAPDENSRPHPLESGTPQHTHDELI